MIDRISLIHMMEKEGAAEAARRFAAIFLSCTHSYLSIMLIALSSRMSMTYTKYTALDAWELLQPVTAAGTEFSVKKSYG